jgi:hypothetical protein
MADIEHMNVKQNYYTQRIKLFEKYQERETKAKEDAKTANTPLKGGSFSNA